MFPSQNHRQFAISLLGRESRGDDDQYLIRALEEFLELAAAGQAPTVESFVGRYPEIAGELRECLAGLALLQQAVPDVAASVASLTPAAAVAPAITEPLGDYRVLREGGRGGMGIVYEAQQLSLGRRVALKILPLAAVLDPRQLQRFKNEALAAAQLDHPNIVEVYGVGSERGIHYFAMRFVDGCSLAEVIDARTRQPAGASDSASVDPQAEAAPHVLPLAERETIRAMRDSTARSSDFFGNVAQLGIQAAEALDHAHQSGVIHRDVKPSNLMLDPAGKVWITDFGLARIGADAQFTMTGDLLGTLRYMSPEQASGRPTMIDHRTDIYSLGATLYELATDRPVVRGQERAAMLREIAEMDPAHPRTIAPAMPVDLETVLLKALSKEPAARYETAQALADDLRRFLEHKPVLARRATRWDQTAKWVRRHRAVSALLTVAVGAVLLLLSGALWHNYRLREEIAKSDARNLELRQLAYVRDIPLVDEARKEGKLPLANELLARHVPKQNELDVRDFAWHWLNRTLHDEELVLRGHDGPVSAVAYNSTGTRIATGGHDGTVRIWDAKTGAPLRVLDAHHGNVNCLQFFRHGTEIISAGDDGLLRQWRVDDGERLHTFKGHVGNVLSLSISPNEQWLASGGEDYVLRIWDLADRKLARSLIDANHRINVVLFSPDGQHLAAGSRDGHLRLYRSVDWEIVWTQSRHIDQPVSLCFDRPGANLLVGDNKGHAKLLSVASGERVVSVLNVTTRQRAVALRDDGRRFLTVDLEGRLFQDSVHSTTKPPYRYTHASRVWAAARSPDDRNVAIAADDSTARVWSLDRPLGAEVFLQMPTERMLFALSSDGTTVACVSDQQLQCWDTATRTQVGAMSIDGSSVNALAMSEDGEWMAYSVDDSEMSLVDVRTMQRTRTWRFPHRVKDVMFQPGGSYIAVRSSTAIYLRDRADANRDRDIDHNSVNAIAFSPDGSSFAASRFDDDGLTMWDVASWSKRFAINGIGNHNIAFSPDGNDIAIPHRDGSVALRDASTGALRFRLSGRSPSRHDIPITFFPDGNLLAVHDGAGRFRLISLAARRELLLLEDMFDDEFIVVAPDSRSLWSIRRRDGECSLIRWSIELPSEHSRQHANPSRGLAQSPPGNP